MFVSKTHRRFVRAINSRNQTIRCTIIGIRDEGFVVRRPDIYGDWLLIAGLLIRMESGWLFS